MLSIMKNLIYIIELITKVLFVFIFLLRILDIIPDGELVFAIWHHGYDRLHLPSNLHDQKLLPVSSTLLQNKLGPLKKLVFFVDIFEKGLHQHLIYYPPSYSLCISKSTKIIKILIETPENA